MFYVVYFCILIVQNYEMVFYYYVELYSQTIVAQYVVNVSLMYGQMHTILYVYKVNVFHHPVILLSVLIRDGSGKYL